MLLTNLLPNDDWLCDDGSGIDHWGVGSSLRVGWTVGTLLRWTVWRWSSSVTLRF